MNPDTGPEDPALWRTTDYCPPIELRMELLGVSEDIVHRDLAEGQCHVVTARAQAVTAEP